MDAQGRLQALSLSSAGDAITPRWLERALPALAAPMDLPDRTSAEGLFDLPYGVPHQRIAHEATHNLLFGLCADGPLADNDDGERHASPLRPDARPIDGVLHATCVSARVHRMLSRLLAG